MKEVRELKKGELFVWNMQPDYLHQFTGEWDENNNPIGNHIATKYSGSDVWSFHEPRPSNWNPFCTVQVVKF